MKVHTLMIILDFTKPVSVPLRLLASGAEFELLEDIQVDISDNPEVPLHLIIPAGFKTDLASIPPEAGILGFEKLGKHSYAAIVHDYMWSKGMGYELSNAAFFTVLDKLGCGWWTSFCMAFSVQAAGRSRYKKNLVNEKAGGAL
jgi:Protein of unknown function (DUF1353)